MKKNILKIRGLNRKVEIIVKPKPEKPKEVKEIVEVKEKPNVPEQIKGNIKAGDKNYF